MSDNHTKFSQFSDNEQSPMTFLVVSVTSRVDKKGDDFCDIEASDGDQVAKVKLWKTSQEESGLKPGDVITAMLAAVDYKGSLSFSFQPDSYTHEPAERQSEFVKTAPVPSSVMWEWIEREISSMRPSLRYICQKLILGEKATYLTASAARSIHHSYIGGLAYHSWRMSRSAAALAEIYEADREMCIAGALLHDIGKTREMVTDQLGHVEYTVEGHLKGHLLIGCEMVEDAAREMPEDIKAEAGDDVACLVHIIASHHGKQEMGAIKQPYTREAFIVSECDMLDMKLTICETEGALVMPGNLASQDNFVVGRVYVPAAHGSTEDLDADSGAGPLFA